MQLREDPAPDHDHLGPTRKRKDAETKPDPATETKPRSVHIDRQRYVLYTLNMYEHRGGTDAKNSH